MLAWKIWARGERKQEQSLMMTQLPDCQMMQKLKSIRLLNQS